MPRRRGKDAGIGGGRGKAAKAGGAQQTRSGRGEAGAAQKPKDRDPGAPARDDKDQAG